MNPTLIIVAGPLKSSPFDLTEPEISIGREINSHVRLSDPSVSRRHAVIKRENESYKIIDLDSFNGTYVNGIPVINHSLKHGDQIAIGDVILLFLQQETEEDPIPESIALNDEDFLTQSTVRLRGQDAFYLQPQKILEALSPTARIARDLYALLRISRTLTSIRDSKSFQERLLELILEIVPAERGAILLAAEGVAEFSSAVCCGKLSGSEEKLFVSRTAARHALVEGIGLLINDVAANASLRRAESLVDPKIRGLICVPLTFRDTAIGVIYLDTRNAESMFDEHHLQLVTAIAGIASPAIENLKRAETLASENQRLNVEINLHHKMVGESKKMQELYRFIAKVSPAETSVLLRGESGTGKELVARAIHINSTRSQKPFVAINCATLTEALLESELFGHEKGAFTGALKQKKGKLEIADGGTIFFDEVGELALNIQAKLLRALQEREFERVGGTRSIKADFRLIAATNRDLEASVRNGTFREDLYYRLNVISVVLPPLRQRSQDIPLLAKYFAAESGKRIRQRSIRLSSEALACLINYSWPGNVRELRNVIERAVVLGETDSILPEDLPEELLETAATAGVPMTQFYDALRETKKQMIVSACRQAKNYVDAAKMLGIHVNNLHRLIRTLDIKEDLGK
jgi:transcriptional regulator with GAF, ATPase, and Fis domain